MCQSEGCTPEGKKKTDDARKLGNTATAVFVGGAALTGIGIVVVIAGGGKSTPAQIGLAAHPGGLSLQGEF